MSSSEARDRHVGNLALEFLEARLDPTEAQEATVHLAGCRECQAELAALEQFLRLFAAEPEPVLPRPELFLADVRRRLRTEKGLLFRLRLRRGLRWGLSFATGLLLAVVAWQLVPRPRAPAADELLAAYLTEIPSWPTDLLGSEDDNVLVVSPREQEELRAVEAELLSSAELDELLEELTSGEQTRLLGAMQALSGPRWEQTP